MASTHKSQPLKWSYPDSLIESLQERVKELERSVEVRERIILCLGIAFVIALAYMVSPYR